jgi:hypothetical protein
MGRTSQHSSTTNPSNVRSYFHTLHRCVVTFALFSREIVCQGLTTSTQPVFGTRSGVLPGFSTPSQTRVAIQERQPLLSKKLQIFHTLVVLQCVCESQLGVQTSKLVVGNNLQLEPFTHILAASQAATLLQLTPLHKLHIVATLISAHSVPRPQWKGSLVGDTILALNLLCICTEYQHKSEVPPVVGEVRLHAPPPPVDTSPVPHTRTDHHLFAPPLLALQYVLQPGGAITDSRDQASRTRYSQVSNGQWDIPSSLRTTGNCPKYGLRTYTVCVVMAPPPSDAD